jgi:hypothetical protein
MSTGSGKRYTVRFLFFKFDLESLTEVENFSALNTQIYQIANGFGGRQV